MDNFFTKNSQNEIVWDVDKLSTFTHDKNTCEIPYFTKTDTSVSILRYKKYHVSNICFEIEYYDYFTTSIEKIDKDQVFNGNCCYLCGSMFVYHMIGYECYLCDRCNNHCLEKCNSRRMIKQVDKKKTVYILNDQFSQNWPYKKLRDAVVNKKYFFERLTLNIDNYHPSYFVLFNFPACF